MPTEEINILNIDVEPSQPEGFDVQLDLQQPSSPTLSLGVVLPIGQGGGGAIQSISRNGVELPIIEGNVDITVPTSTSELVNDSGFITSAAISGKVDRTELAQVAFSGDYDDLQNKPEVPSLDGYETETYVNDEIAAHNTSETAHSDIREQIETVITDLGDKVNKSIPSAANNIALLNAQGGMRDSGIQPSNLLLYNNVTLNVSTASWNSGGYYTVSNGTTLNSGTGYYISQLDISEYAGSYMFIDVNAITPSSSSRACLITDDAGNIVAQGVEKIATSTDPQFVYDSEIGKYRLELKLPANAKYAYLSVSTNATSRTIQFGYKKADIDPNGRVGVIYVDAVNGSDANDGSRASQLKTFTAAVTLAVQKGYRDTTFILSEGEYRESFNIASLIGRVTVIGSNLGETIFDNSYILTNWSAVSGYNGVYSCTHTSTINRYSNAGGVIFEDLHPSRQISNNERHPLQRGLTHRLPFTPIYESSETTLSEALADISANGGWYIDGTTIYMKNSDGSNPNTNGYSYKLPRVNFSSSMPDVTSAHMVNISWRYGFRTNFKVPYLERRNCSLIGSYGDGFKDDCYAVSAYMDEVCFCNNDGIQGHGTVTTDWQTLSVRAYTPSCEYIDCWCHDNFDDGLSFHEASKISIRGGLFEHNWDGGIRMSNTNASVVTGAYARYNGEALSGAFTGSGFDAVNANFSNEQRTGVTCVFQNCISEGNKYGFACDTSARYAFVDVINCTSMNNLTAEFYNAAATAVLNVLNSDCTPLDMSKIVSGVGAININCARQFTFSLGTIDYAAIALPANPGTAEYNATFTSSTSGDITASLPLTYWQGNTDIVAGKTYSFSIQNGVGFIIQLD